MDLTLLTYLNTVFLVAATVAGLVTGLSEARKIAAMVSDVAAIQRAIFLQLRRQYQDIDEDLKTLDRNLQEVRNLVQAGKEA
jgi:hypothetical protein